jgi:hypothetical protein
MTVVLGLAAAGCPGSSSVEIQPLDDQTVRVGETLNLDLAVRNPGGAMLSFTFSMPDLPDSGAEIYSLGSSGGRFRWTPLASHAGAHQCTITASAGGGSDQETIVINVQQANSAPVFIQPGAGGTYDLTRDPCVTVHAEVKDDDSLPASIQVFERDPRIEGATLTPSGKQADWRWCPTPAQVDASDRYTLALAARDEAHEPVSHDYVIVLRGEGRTECTGTGPEIVSSSPPPPDVLATSLDYRIVAVVRDDVGLKDAPILYWSTDAPADPLKPDVTAFQQVVFTADGGENYHAAIPNLNLPEGERRTIYYVISATDNDDPTGVGCDHRTDSALRQFDVASGTGTERVGYCETCSNSAQCDAGQCVAGVSRFCGAACPSCPSGATCRTVTTVEGTSLESCVPEGLSCRSTGPCTDDSYEDNDTRTAAAAIGPDVYTGLQICARDQDYFQLSAGSSGTLELTIDGWDEWAVDLDLMLLRGDGTPMRVAEGIEGTEQISACVSGGTYYAVVYGIADDQSPYNLMVDLTAGSCCTDDPLEENDGWRSATPLLDPSDTPDGQICSGDEDWFVFAGEGGRRAMVDLVIEGAGDLDLELYDTDGLRRLASSAGTSDFEHLEADLAASGDYYIRVFGYRGAEATYLVSYELGGGTGCTTSAGCPSGTICNGTACVDDACTPGASTCPSGAFCPEAGGTGGASDCVEPCWDAGDCRSGYACKVFAAGAGCAVSGPGSNGDPCTSFRNCAGERTCLPWPGGYCAVQGCAANGDCPSGSKCISLGGSLGTCVEDCLASDDLCRLAEGYSCECAEDLEGAWQFVCLAPGATAPWCY